MREPRRLLSPLTVLPVLAVLGATCRSEPVAPPESGPSPSASLRPLTSRDGSPSMGGVPDASPAGSLPPGHPPLGGTAVAPARPAPDNESVSGTISVSPAMASRAGGAALFIIARSGPARQIVAVRREEASAFPMAFRISGADAMTAGTTFAGPLEITARLSKSGDAVAGRGDLSGVVKDVAVGARDVKIVLDTVHQ